MRRRAVILLKPHDNGPREVLFKPQDVANLSPAPAVNRLVVIPDAANILVPARQQPQPEVLRHIGILILVNKDVAEPSLVLVKNVFVFLENHHHVQQQIAKIDRIQFPQTGLILIVNLGTAIVIGACLGRGHFIRCPRTVLPVVDDASQLTRWPTLVVKIGGLNQLLQ